LGKFETPAWLLHGLPLGVEDEDVLGFKAFLLDPAGGHVDLVAFLNRDAAAGAGSPAQAVEVAAEFADQFAGLSGRGGGRGGGSLLGGL
jgi:hypothetical protein